MRYLATLFGLTMLSHQLGAFFGAWLGGVAKGRVRELQTGCGTDMTLALLAAIVSLPSARPGRAGAARRDRVNFTHAFAAGGDPRNKFSIGEHGFIALVLDTEGNMFRLHSMK